MTLRVLLALLAALAVTAGAPFVGDAGLGEHGEFVLWQLRVPRVLVGALVGATLSTAGATFQIVFQNPLATPSTVGTTAGAALGALAALVLGASLASPYALVLSAFAGALAVSLALGALASSGRIRQHDVLLAGIAITLAASALSTGLQYTADLRALFAATQWSLGHLPQVGYRGVVVLAPFVAVSLGVSLSLARGLHSLALGEDLAHAQGVDVPRLRALAIGFGALGVAATVAWCGPIAFVGLIVPHLVRRIGGASPRSLLPLSAALGAAFLVACDLVARLVVPGRDLPVGVITAALGAPLVVALVARRR